MTLLPTGGLGCRLVSFEVAAHSWLPLSDIFGASSGSRYLGAFVNTVPWCRLSSTVNGCRTKDSWGAQELPLHRNERDCACAHVSAILKGNRDLKKHLKLQLSWRTKHSALIYDKLNNFHLGVFWCWVSLQAKLDMIFLNAWESGSSYLFCYLRRHTH